MTVHLQDSRRTLVNPEGLYGDVYVQASSPALAWDLVQEAAQQVGGGWEIVAIVELENGDPRTAKVVRA